MGSAITASGWARILLISFVAGIALASFLSLSIIFPLLCIGLVGVLCLGCWGATWDEILNRQALKICPRSQKTFVAPKKTLLTLCLGALLLGVIRYQVALPRGGEGSLAAFVGHEVVVEGVISDEVQVSSQMQSFVLDHVVVDGRGVRHKILARVPRYPEFFYRDRIRLSCKLEAPEPFEGFRYDRYLAKEGVLAICQSYREPFSLGAEAPGVRGRLLHVKTGILDRVRHTFHEPYGALLEGLLLGEKRLPEGVEEDFRRVGLSHIIAASGQNVVLVTDVLFWLLVSLGFYRRRASFLIIAGIGVYVLLAGADAAIVRAGIMGAVLMVAKGTGRVPSGINILLAALGLMLLHNPLLLRDDVGFQLSFAATAGLMILQPKLSHFFFFLPRAIGIREAVSTSAAAIAATLPIMILSFGEVSFLAPLANLLVLPLIPFVMIAGGLILVLSALLPQVAFLLSAPVVGGLKVMLGSAHLLSQLPFAAADISEVLLLKGVLFIAALFLLRFLLSLRFTSTQAGSELSVRSFVVVGCILLIPMLPDLARGTGARAHFFSVGQGDATLLEVSSGERWLIDGGPDDTVLTKLGQVLPWYERRIDVLIPTHADADHITGLIELSRRYHIGQVYLSANDPGPKMQLLKVLWKDVPQEVVWAGRDLSREGVKVRVLGPPDGFKSDDRNDLSVILFIEHSGRSLLLTGDASQEREHEILSELGHVDILKAGHHGSYTSTSHKLLQTTTPDVAVISSGADNRYGHPHGVVLKRLEEVGAEILRTDLQGDVEISLEGERNLNIRTGRRWY